MTVLAVTHRSLSLVIGDTLHLSPWIPEAVHHPNILGNTAVVR